MLPHSRTVGPFPRGWGGLPWSDGSGGNRYGGLDGPREDRLQGTGDPVTELADGSPTVETQRGESGSSTDGDLTVTPGGADDDGRGDAPSATHELPLDVTFEILKNERRRVVLRYLDERSEPCQLGELSEHVAALENDKPEAQLTSSERKRVYIALYQCHLPKLDAADVVSFDGDRGTIARGEHFDYVVDVLNRSEREDASADSPWAVYYLATAASGSVGVAIAGFGMGHALGVSVVSTLTLGAIAALSLLNRRAIGPPEQ